MSNYKLSYDGPYPRRTLERARRILIDELQNCSSRALESVKPKIGIQSSSGRVIQLPPLPGRTKDDHMCGYEESCMAYLKDREPSKIEFRMKSRHIENNCPDIHTSRDTTQVHQLASSLFVGGNSTWDSNFSNSNPHHTSASAYDETNFLPSVSYPSSSVSYSGSNIYRPNDTGKALSPPVEDSNVPVFYSGLFSRKNVSPNLSSKSATLSRPPSLSPSPTEDEHKHKTVKRTYSEEFLRSNEELDFANKRQRVMEEDVFESDSCVSIGRTHIELSPLKQSVYRGNSYQYFKDSKNVVLVYKCDFCKAASYTIDELRQHLVTNQHLSGSLYNARKKAGADAGIELISIKKMLVAKNEFCKVNHFVVVCPECQDIFEDIFMCALHYKYVHNSINGFYSLCPIIDHKTVIVFHKPICSKCKQNFDSQSSLHKHWSEAKHHPLSHNTKTFSIIICPYCDKNFSNNFITGKMHTLQHDECSDKESVALQIKEAQLPVRRLELPPLDSTDENGLVIELKILENMQKKISAVAGINMKTKDMKTRIRYLKSALGEDEINQ